MAPKTSTNRKRRRRETVTKYSTAELTELAKVTPTDIEKAKAAWKRSVPRKYRNLLDAKAINENDTPGHNNQ